MARDGIFSPNWAETRANGSTHSRAHRGAWGVVVLSGESWLSFLKVWWRRRGSSVRAGHTSAARPLSAELVGNFSRTAGAWPCDPGAPIERGAALCGLPSRFAERGSTRETAIKWIASEGGRKRLRRSPADAQRPSRRDEKAANCARVPPKVPPVACAISRVLSF